MMLVGEEYEISRRFDKILDPYVHFVDGKWVYELEDAPDEVKKTYEEYLKWKRNMRISDNHLLRGRWFFDA